MNIEIGSKWIRVSGVDGDTQDRFIGQEVLVVQFPLDMPVRLRHKIWVRRKCRGGKMSTPVWMDEDVFISDFQPLIISLENK